MASLVWVIAALTLLLIILRPGGVPEAMWATAGAVLLVATRAVSLPVAAGAIRDGLEVYAFLIGMMVLAEIARERGVFDALTRVAIARARGSAARLFTLVFASAVCVTALLSNDATAVVVTPSILLGMRQAGVAPLPYLFACAFVANAASFVLPISNPANLLVFSGHVPALGTWLLHLGLPSAGALGATYVLLRVVFARELGGAVALHAATPVRPAARETGVLLWLGALVLIGVSAAGGSLGWATLAVACAVLCVVVIRAGHVLPTIARGVMWSIVPLVAGLFVIVVALERSGAFAIVRRGFALGATLPGPLAALAIGFASGLAANLFNNLPVALSLGSALHAAHTHAAYAALIGVNLGPNLAVSGSLASIMWLAIVRRHGLTLGAGQFLRLGLLVMPPALLIALIFSYALQAFGVP